MAQFRFRPLEALEARENPAALWQTGISQARANEGLVKAVSEYLVATGQTTANPFAPAVISPAQRDYIAKAVEMSEAGASRLATSRLALQAKARTNPAFLGQFLGWMKQWGGIEQQLRGIAAVGRRVGAIVGTNFTPTPTTPTGPTDAGMTNTRPNLNSPNFVDQGNGLKIWDVKVGTGREVAAGSNIRLFYTGWLTDAGATVFDSNRSPKQPVNFDLEGLIQGWQQGIPGMRVGGIRRLYIPAALAYGAEGRPNATPPIPPNADLVFEIKIVGTTP
jgi:FKBP-type peptidyl-prolyl cis-trans isomerase FkpA